MKAPAIFGQATYNISDAVSFTAGGRYTEETTDFYAYTFGATTPPQVGSSKFTAFTPKLGVNWQIGPSLFGYVSYTKGFRSGGFNNRDPVTAEVKVVGYDPEYVNSYELGGKYTTPDNRFRLNVALFVADYLGIHLATFIPNTSFTVTLPAAGAMVKGAEFESAWQINDSVQLYGNLSLSTGKYTDRFECVSQFSVRQDCSNKKMKGVIPTKSNMGVRWSPQFASLSGKLMLNASWAHNDFYYNNTVNEPEIVQTPRLDLFNANLSWTDAAGHWAVAVEGRNLADKIYRQAGLLTTNPTQPATVVYMGPRRTVIGRVGYSF